MALFVIFPIRLYQIFISPMLGRRCRFYPSCSQYGLEAIKLHGIWIGLWLLAKRLVKCHPGCKGGFDPVPEKKKVK
ncbi:membrane protein insertion efficiency factor YidD [Facilibium subflavum]|uniref:membrane protein insertion efficiency factor YidD n=1 Tax=Facilibium subflavum TaxID=2219058 RepID=UPI001AADB532|nr:membrane protein insertion efficiency factor YidD [Facilibium subflavum]